MSGMMVPPLRDPRPGDFHATMARPSDIDPIRLCMTEEESASWRFLNHRTAQAAVATPCWDCTEDFAAEMRPFGLCNGSPGEPLRACPAHGEQAGDWWIVVHRAGGPPGYICRRCNEEAKVERERQRISAHNHATYLRIMGDPERAARRKDTQAARWKVRLGTPGVREKKRAQDAERQRRRYAEDPVFRQSRLETNRARPSRARRRKDAPE